MAAQEEEDKPWLPSDSPEEEQHRDKPWLPSESDEEDQHLEKDKPTPPSDRAECEPHRAQMTEKDEPWLPDESDEEETHLTPTTKDELWLPDESDEEEDRKETGGFKPLDNPSTSEAGAARTRYIPTTRAGFPRTFDSTSYFNWVIDRYKSWIKPEDLPKGKESINQIRETFDISDKGHIFRNLWDH